MTTLTSKTLDKLNSEATQKWLSDGEAILTEIFESFDQHVVGKYTGDFEKIGQLTEAKVILRQHLESMRAMNEFTPTPKRTRI